MQETMKFFRNRHFYGFVKDWVKIQQNRFVCRDCQRLIYPYSSGYHIFVDVLNTVAIDSRKKPLLYLVCGNCSGLSQSAFTWGEIESNRTIFGDKEVR